MRSAAASDAFDPDPPTLAEVREMGVYPARVAARLLRVHVETLRVTYKPAFLPKPRPNSANRLLGREILRLAGVREIDRAARTAEGGESEQVRQKRAAADLARIRELTTPGRV